MRAEEAVLHLFWLPFIWENIAPHPSRCREKDFINWKIVSESIWSEDLEADFHIVCLKDCLLLLAIRVFFEMLVLYLICICSQQLQKMTYFKGAVTCSPGKWDPVMKAEAFLAWLKKNKQKNSDTFPGSLCKIYLHFLNLGFLIH